MPLHIGDLYKNRRAGLYVVTHTDRIPIGPDLPGLFKIGLSTHLGSRLNNYALSFPTGVRVLGLFFLRPAYASMLTDRDKKIMKVLLKHFERLTFEHLANYELTNNMRRGRTEWVQCSFTIIQGVWENMYRKYHAYLEEPIMDFYRDLPLKPSADDFVLRVHREKKTRPKVNRKRTQALAKPTPVPKQAMMEYYVDKLLKVFGK